MQARLAQSQCNEAACLEWLAQALRLGRQHNGASFFRNLDLTMGRLFPLALDRDMDTDYVRELIRRFRLKPPSLELEAWPWPLKVRTLGHFAVLAEDRPLEFGRKTPRKVLALLKVLVALGPGEVAERRVLDALWPDDEGDAAQQSLRATLLRLRRLLGGNDTIRQRGGKLSIERQRVWVDAWSFEQRLAQLPPDGAVQDDEVDAVRKALALYRGGFLDDDGGEPWSLTPRERLRGKFVQALVKLGRHLESRQRYEESIAWYLRGLGTDPMVEAFYQGLMRCYEKLDRRPEAIGVYRRLKQTLSVSLGLRPSATTERLCRELGLGGSR
jgi:DNA-binding SARP family transcriptional activator